MQRWIHRVRGSFSGVRGGVCAVLAIALAASTLPAFAQTVRAENSVVRVAFMQDGGYQIRARGTRWTLNGKLNSKPESITRKEGTDKLGAWEEVDARTATQVAGIRVYEDAPVVLFRDTRLKAVKNRNGFPEFERLPAGVMEVSYGLNPVAKDGFGEVGGGGRGGEGGGGGGAGARRGRA